MAWRLMDVRDRRLRYVVAASHAGANLSGLCAEFEISRVTGYLWRERYRCGGLAAMSERSRRPRSPPRRTGERIEQRIMALRVERPNWGARKLAVLLAREGTEMPPATVHRVLLRKGLVRLDDRRRQAASRFEREQPNQLWQMDFKSPKGWEQPEGAEVVRLQSHGRLRLHGKRWQVASPLAGEPVQIVRLDRRVLILYCNTVFRELNLAGEDSTSVEPSPANPTL